MSDEINSALRRAARQPAATPESEDWPRLTEWPPRTHLTADSAPPTGGAADAADERSSDWDAGARAPTPSKGPSMNQRLMAGARATRRARHHGGPSRPQPYDFAPEDPA